MLIDWFTVIAQVINFLILVWLLKRFLYKPILLAIDTRERAVADQITQAASKQNEAEREQEEFRGKNADFDRARAALLAKAVDDTKTERQKLLEAARKECDTLRSQQQETLTRERADVSEQLVQRTCQEVFAVTRKTLSDLASTSIEEAAADMFVQRLRRIGAKDKALLVNALTEAPRTALVRSAFDLPEAQRASLVSAVNEMAAVESDVQFESVPNLVSGIELTSGGYKLSWNIAEYLDSMEKNLSAKSAVPSPADVSKEIHAN